MGLGDFVSGLLGSKNKYKQATPQVDPNAYQYAGRPGGADEAAEYYRTLGAEGQGRQGERVDYSQANADRQNAAGARQGQQGMADEMAARAMGLRPSIAQMQADRQMQQANAAQSSAAASARGAGAMALAQQNAAGNIANADSAISGQAQINGANEQMQNEQNAFGAYSGLRGQDYQGQGQAAQQAQYQSSLNSQQRAQNDQYQLGMTNAEMGVRNSQLTASMNQQSQQSSNALGSGQINAGVSGQNASMNQSNALGALGTVGSTAGSLVLGSGGGGGTPPPKAKGGPVAERQPYLVGEQGPELIVPRQAGTVIPAGPTAAILAMMSRPARAAGGPVEAGGAPAGYAPSTWGTGGPATEAQDIARAEATTAADQHQRAVNEAEAWQNPYERDANDASKRIAVSRALGQDAAEGDMADLRRNRALLAMQRKEQPRPERDTGSAEEKKAVMDGKAVPTNPASKRPTVGDLVSKFGDMTQKQASGIDTSYHGGGGGQISGPHLLALPGRAMGGPVQAGGQSGIVDAGGGGITSNMVKQAAAGSRDQFNTIGGGGIVGGTNTGDQMGGAMSSLGGNLHRMAANVDTSYHPFLARAEGGPVEAGGGVLPLYEPPGKQLHQSDDGHAFYADAPNPGEDRNVIARQPASPAEVVMSLAKSKASPSPAPAQRQMTPEEMKRAADEMMRQLGGEYSARMAAGPAVRRQ